MSYSYISQNQKRLPRRQLILFNEWASYKFMDLS
jgi:hypothetical protein